MVHRPTDARLLTNLLAQDKEHSKHFNTFLEAASASISSLSAYAAASAPPTSHIILKVSGSLESADDALRRYAASIDEWREQLKALKTLEDEVSNIFRDREILVTKLLKATKHRQSTGNLQRAKQFPSSSSLATNKSDFSSSVPGYSKLSHAQSQLQACEAHLAEKENELGIRRCVIIKAGLDVRFRAMVECGWAWSEIGKEALGTLEQLTALAEEQSRRPNLTSINTGTKSILSTFHPSASEPVSVGQPLRSESPGFQRRQPDDAIYTSMNIPPAHAIADMDMHVAVLLPSPPPSNGSHDVSPLRSASSVSVRSQNEHGMPRSRVAEERPNEIRRHILSRRITEEELEQARIFSSHDEKESISEDGHDGGSLTAVDNPRFVKGKKSRQYNTEKLPSKRDRRRSLFGSLRGLFGHHRKNAVDEGQTTHEGSSGLFGGKKNKWDMRTERNLRKMDAEDEKQLHSVARLNSPPRSAAKTRRASDGEGNRGSLSDNETRRRKLTRGRGRRTGPLSRKRSSSMPPVSPVASPSRNAEDAEVKQRPVSLTPPAQTNSKPPPRVGVLSRSSSITSAATAPVVSKTAERKPSANRVQVERRASLGDKSMGGGSGTGNATGHVRSGSNGSLGDGRKGILHFTPTTDATANTSLMSIVEDVARANRDATEKLKVKKNLSMANLLPDQHASSENATSPGSSTLTLRAGSGSASPPGPSGPAIYIPKAPQSLGRKELEAWGKEGSMTVSTTASPASTPEKQREGRTSLGPGAGSSPSRRPAQSPLRSALRNPNSRSASPAPVAGSDHVTRNGSIPASATLPTPAASNEQVGRKGHDTDDAASVSSYETGREVPLEDPFVAPESGPVTKDVNVQVADKKHEADAEARMLSPPPASVLSSNSTPQRRKSVRVSLQPTFSPSPPIIYDDDETREKNGIIPPKAVWSAKQPRSESGTKTNGRSSKRRSEDVPLDLWEYSSDEDEEYANAKRLLSRVSSTPLKKG
ncbi:hypothetical protein F5887DRAFT_108876 [Amanita rubescens]|nr:hypothetical protein F5887DRAFT_108876 [Amanita rubescens]